jgi:hypothetical protein
MSTFLASRVEKIRRIRCDVLQSVKEFEEFDEDVDGCIKHVEQQVSDMRDRIALGDAPQITSPSTRLSSITEPPLWR